MAANILRTLDRRFGSRRFYRFIRELMRRISEDKVSSTGAQLAYYLILSFFPFLLFLLALVPYTPLASQDVLAQVLSVMPGETRALIEPILRDIVSQRSAALLSTALFFSLWSGSSGMGNLLEAMSAAFDIPSTRPALLKRVLAVLFTLMLAVIILLALISQVFGDQIVRVVETALGGSTVIRPVWQAARTILPLLVMTLGFALLFRFGPGFPADFRVTFGETLLGGIFTAAAWMLISQAFSFYVDNFSRYANTYGSLGGIIILLTWLYISSVVIMAGAEVNASYIAIYKADSRQRQPKTRLEQPVPPAGQPEMNAQLTSLAAAGANRSGSSGTTRPGAVMGVAALGFKEASQRTRSTIGGSSASLYRPSELLGRRPERERALSVLITAGLMFWLLKQRDKR